MGGNVFDGKTANIKLENIVPTLTVYFSELATIFPNKSTIFNTLHFQPVGSVGKKSESGDIDLAIDISDILDANMSAESIAMWGINPVLVDVEAALLQKRARTSTPTQLRIKAFLKILTSHINVHAPHLHCNEKKVTDGNIFSFYPQYDADANNLGIGVQVDWMIGNIKWLRFSYYSSSLPVGSNVKGLHRTQLILAAFQIANLSFNHVNGVKDKATGKVVATDPDCALLLLGSILGFDVTQSDAENYYNLHALFKLKMRNNDYSKLLDVYLKILDSTRTDIPDDLYYEWRNRQEILGLTGKFLPENSILNGVI